MNQNPLKLGANLVIHSATKFLCGHSDAMGGLLCGDKALVEQAFRFREINGASLQADPAYLILSAIQFARTPHNNRLLSVSSICFTAFLPTFQLARFKSHTVCGLAKLRIKMH